MCGVFAYNKQWIDILRLVGYCYEYDQDLSDFIEKLPKRDKERFWKIAREVERLTIENYNKEYSNETEGNDFAANGGQD